VLWVLRRSPRAARREARPHQTACFGRACARKRTASIHSPAAHSLSTNASADDPVENCAPSSDSAKCEQILVSSWCLPSRDGAAGVDGFTDQNLQYARSLPIIVTPPCKVSVALPVIWVVVPST
jgi:hypothetical protein